MASLPSDVCTGFSIRRKKLKFGMRCCGFYHTNVRRCGVLGHCANVCILYAVNMHIIRRVHMTSRVHVIFYLV